MANDLDYAIIIGIEHYRGSLNQLSGPHQDSQQFRDWALSERGGDIPKDNIKELYSTADYTPIKDDIDDWLGSTLEQLTLENKRGRRLYLYFSGHGIGSSQRNSALLLPKWSHSNRQYGLASEKYLEELAANGTFREIYIFLDCCRNRITNVSGSPPFFSSAKPSSNPCEYLVFYATEFDNFAYEGATTTTLDNLLPRGLFTEVLLTGLNGAAADKDGRLLLGNLINYVKRVLPQLAQARKKAQVPRTETSIDDHNKLLAPPFEKKVPMKIRFSTADGAAAVLEDTDLEVVHTGFTDDGEWDVMLTRGFHVVRRADKDTGVFFYVDGINKELIINELS